MVQARLTSGAVDPERELAELAALFDQRELLDVAIEPLDVEGERQLDRGHLLDLAAVALRPSDQRDGERQIGWDRPAGEGERIRPLPDHIGALVRRS